MGRKTATASHVSVDDHVRPTYAPAGGDIWSTGALKRMPWLGLACIIGVLGCIAALIIIIHASAGTETESWPLQPSVFIAIIIAVLNPMISVALSEGATIFWWRRVLQPRCTVADLHDNWQHGASLRHAAFAGRKTSLLTGAFLLAAIAPLNGPLIQRATRVVVARATTERTLMLDAASDLPYGYTGFISGRSRAPSLFTADFANVVQQFANSTPVAYPNSGCRGTCFGAKLNGLGFAVQCNSSTVPYQLYEFSSNGTTNGQTFDGLNVFETGFNWYSGLPSSIYLNVAYKGSADSEGVLQVRNCSLTLANVAYPVTIDGNNSIISLDPSSSIFDDTIMRMSPVEDSISSESGPTTLGGAGLALSNQFYSWAHLRNVGSWGFEVRSSGSMSTRYVDPSSIGYAANYSIVWRDPTQDLLAAARELIFRTSIAAANGTNTQLQRVTETRIKLLYEARYPYMAASAALTLVCLLALLPTFFGYWALGRSVSMSPVEIGKAFGARIMETHSSNDSAEATVDAIGQKAVSYGVTEQGNLQILAAGEVGRPLPGSRIA